MLSDPQFVTALTHLVLGVLQVINLILAARIRSQQ